MGYGITPFAVSLKKIERVIGKKKSGGLLGRLFATSSASLLREIKRKSAYRFDQDDLVDDEEPTLEQALADLLAGNDLNQLFGHKYAYAFELLCDHFGRALNNSMWSAIGIEWVEQVEEAMKQAGIDEHAISVSSHLMNRGAPVSIPTPDDFPAVGYLRRGEIDAAAQALDSADLSEMDEDLMESVEQLRQWCARCRELGTDLVCFYY